MAAEMKMIVLNLNEFISNLLKASKYFANIFQVKSKSGPSSFAL
jgi:hypothetical protein